jgi:predicted permease
VAVISYALWQRRFGGAPDVIGRLLPGQLADFEIVGVMPRSFAYPVGAVHPTEVWIPNVFQAEDRVRADSFSYRLEVLGRLRDGVTIEAAQTQMDQITARLAAATPRWFTDRVAKVEPLREYLTRGVRRWLVMIFASVVVVLLIACVNLSNQTLARAVTRHREVTIRAALGASRWDLARAVLIESLLLSLAGAALGALAAWSGIEVLRAALPEDIPRTANIAIDGRVLAVSALVAIVTGLSFSLAPVIALWRQSHARTTGLTGRANTSAPGHERVRGVLLVAEVSLAVVLLVGAGLFAGSFMRVSHVDLGMNTRDVLTVRIRPFVGAANWKDAQLRHRRLLYDVLDRVRAIPGVDAAAMVTGGLPLSGNLQTQDLSIPGLTLPSNEDLDRNHISVDYFHVLRVPLLKGRLFTESDREQSEPVVIINDVAARRYFPGQDPIGRVIDFEGHRTIVGIVGNIRHEGPETDWRRQGFIPLDQSLATTATLVARLSRPEADVVPDIKAAIWSRFPAVPLPEIRTLDDYLRHMTAERRFNMLLLALFGVLGIVIADVGLYGVMAYVVSQRTREIGIRMALGAQPVTIHRAVLGRAMTYLATGTAIGLLIAWGSTGLVASFLFELGPHDATVYGTVALVFLSIGLLAAFVPARRAARVDPVVALKAE